MPHPTDEHDLSEGELARARELVPIVCIDVLPWRRGEEGLPEVCLIERDDRPGQWNLIGGRVQREEELDAAVRRHLHSTLGPGVSWSRSDFGDPEAVCEYFAAARSGHGLDPRQHAVSLNYALELVGEVSLGGEAAGQRWFGLEELPEPDRFGYGQGSVAHKLVPVVRRQAAGG